MKVEESDEICRKVARHGNGPRGVIKQYRVLK